MSNADLDKLARSLTVTAEALQSLGITRNGTAWLIPERDATGEIIGRAKRHDDGSKGFVKGGNRGLTYVHPLGNYAGSSMVDPVFIVEGMSDVAAGLDMGLDIVGRPSATGGGEHLAELLKGRHACIVAENDDAGQNGARSIAEKLAGSVQTLRIVSPPAEHKDLRTWYAAPGGIVKGDLLEQVAELPEWQGDAVEGVAERRLLRNALTRRLSEVEPERLSWLWPGRLAIGKLAIIAGNGGLGKSTVTMDIASRVTTGIGWPDRPGERFEPGGVVLLSAEDDAADTIRPRMDAAGADVCRVTLLDGVSICERKDGPATESHIDLATDLPALEQAIEDTPDCKLVVIDPVTAYMGKADDHRNAEVRGLLAPLSRLAERRRVAVLCVTHLNKGQGEAIHRIVGSIAFGAAARIALAVTKDPDDSSRRLMMNVKSNIAPEHTGLAFRVEPCSTNAEAGVVVWDDEPVQVTADAAMNSVGDGGGGNQTALDEAADWLADKLADGPLHAGEVKQEAKADGIAPRTLDRAKARLGVIAAPDGLRGPWCWRLPDESAES